MDKGNKQEIAIGVRKVGEGHPVYIVAEIGINHNGDLNSAMALIDEAAAAGCDAVKFQKRSPDICVPQNQRNVIRETPWGAMTYLEYRHKIEFAEREYAAIDTRCREKGITWFASCWDRQSVDFIRKFNPCCYKVASACLTNFDLLSHTKTMGIPIILSTGMSTMDEIDAAVSIIGREDLLMVHTTSSYSYLPAELNLKMIQTLRKAYACPVGYSGHEEGRVATVAAVALGACYIERHITLDPDLWGSDHRISLNPHEFRCLTEEIRLVESALGDGVKRVYDSEKRILAKLRP